MADNKGGIQKEIIEFLKKFQAQTVMFVIACLVLFGAMGVVTIFSGAIYSDIGVNECVTSSTDIGIDPKVSFFTDMANLFISVVYGSSNISDPSTYNAGFVKSFRDNLLNSEAFITIKYFAVILAIVFTGMQFLTTGKWSLGNDKQVMTVSDLIKFIVVIILSLWALDPNSYSLFDNIIIPVVINTMNLLLQKAATIIPTSSTFDTGQYVAPGCEIVKTNPRYMCFGGVVVDASRPYIIFDLVLSSVFSNAIGKKILALFIANPLAIVLMVYLYYFFIATLFFKMLKLTLVIASSYVVIGIGFMLMPIGVMLIMFNSTRETGKRVFFLGIINQACFLVCITFLFNIVFGLVLGEIERGFNYDVCLRLLWGPDFSFPIPLPFLSAYALAPSNSGSAIDSILTMLFMLYIYMSVADTIPDVSGTIAKLFSSIAEKTGQNTALAIFNQNSKTIDGIQTAILGKYENGKLKESGLIDFAAKTLDGKEGSKFQKALENVRRKGISGIIEDRVNETTNALGRKLLNKYGHLLPESISNLASHRSELKSQPSDDVMQEMMRNAKDVTDDFYKKHKRPTNTSEYINDIKENMKLIVDSSYKNKGRSADLMNEMVDRMGSQRGISKQAGSILYQSANNAINNVLGKKNFYASNNEREGLEAFKITNNDVDAYVMKEMFNTGTEINPNSKKAARYKNKVIESVQEKINEGYEIDEAKKLAKQEFVTGGAGEFSGMEHDLEVYFDQEISTSAAKSSIKGYVSNTINKNIRDGNVEYFKNLKKNTKNTSSIDKFDKYIHKAQMSLIKKQKRVMLKIQKLRKKLDLQNDSKINDITTPRSRIRNIIKNIPILGKMATTQKYQDAQELKRLEAEMLRNTSEPESIIRLKAALQKEKETHASVSEKIEYLTDRMGALRDLKIPNDQKDNNSKYIEYYNAVDSAYKDTIKQIAIGSEGREKFEANVNEIKTANLDAGKREIDKKLNEYYKKVAKSELVKFQIDDQQHESLNTKHTNNSQTSALKMKFMDSISKLTEAKVMTTQQNLDFEQAPMVGFQKLESYKKELTELEKGFRDPATTQSEARTIKEQIGFAKNKISELENLFDRYVHLKSTLDDPLSSVNDKNAYLSEIQTQVAAIKDFNTKDEDEKLQISNLAIIKAEDDVKDLKTVTQKIQQENQKVADELTKMPNINVNENGYYKEVRLLERQMKLNNELGGAELTNMVRERSEKLLKQTIKAQQLSENITALQKLPSSPELILKLQKAQTSLEKANSQISTQAAKYQATYDIWLRFNSTKENK